MASDVVEWPQALSEMCRADYAPGKWCMRRKGHDEPCGTRLARCRECGVAKSEIDALRTEVASLRSRLEGWRPIESAPKDGTPILVWDPSMADHNRYNDGQDDRRYAIGYWRIKSGVGWGNRNASRTEPTHWQPLPSPPHEQPAVVPAEPSGEEVAG